MLVGVLRDTRLLLVAPPQSNAVCTGSMVKPVCAESVVGSLVDATLNVTSPPFGARLSVHVAVIAAPATKFATAVSTSVDESDAYALVPNKSTLALAATAMHVKGIVVPVRT